MCELCTFSQIRSSDLLVLALVCPFELSIMNCCYCRKGERLIEPHPSKQSNSRQPHPLKQHKQCKKLCADDNQHAVNVLLEYIRVWCIHCSLEFILLTAGIFTGQTFVLSSEVSHDLRPLIHQLVESGGDTLTAVGGAGSACDSYIICSLLSSCISESTDNDNLITVCWLVSIK